MTSDEYVNHIQGEYAGPSMGCKFISVYTHNLKISQRLLAVYSENIGTWWHQVVLVLVLLLLKYIITHI